MCWSARSINLCPCRVGRRRERFAQYAANYIKESSPNQSMTPPEWRSCNLGQMLIDAAEDRGPMLFAKMGMLRAANRNLRARLLTLSRRHSHWDRRKLKRASMWRR